MQYIRNIINLVRGYLSPLSEVHFLDDPVTEYIIFAVIFIFVFFAFMIFKGSILHKMHQIAKKTNTSIDDTLVKTVKDIKLLFFFVFSLFVASKFTAINPMAKNIINSGFIIFLIYELVIFTQNVGIYFIKKFWAANTDRPEENSNAVYGLSMILKIILWSVGFLLAMSNLGFEISTLVASLGVSSIAVAFALQSILSDIFSSFSIYLDTPFKLNDFIIIGDDAGIVKKIGIKTTRLQTLQGEELVVSNHELTSTRIRNFKQMEKRRIVFTIGVVYNTPHEKLLKIPEIIKGIIDPMENVDFDRAHFSSYGDFSLNYEIVYFVKTGDYYVYMDTQQKINLDIFKAFEDNGIEFAFPTQTVFLEK